MFIGKGACNLADLMTWFTLFLGVIAINTSNPGKLGEYKEYLGENNVVAQSIDLAEPKADSLTIIQYKASQFENVLVDDVALDVEGLEVGVNIRWLLNELESPLYWGRKCVYSCFIAVHQDGEVKIYRASVPGVLVSPRGDCFGFGRYFLPDGSELTLGEYMNPMYNARYLAVQEYVHNHPYIVLPPLKQWDGEFQ